MGEFKWDDMQVENMDISNLKDWSEFQKLYEDADSIFSRRFNNDGEEEYDECIKAIEKKCAGKISRGKADYNLNRMAQLAKANTYLRKGQYRDERFLESKSCYQKAVVLLEQIFEPDADTDLDFLIQLNLGKYFRNIAKHGRRSDYWRALDEFISVKTRIERLMKNGCELTMFRTQLWMDAVVNIGRAQKYLYQLEEAKMCFCGLIRLLTSFDPKTYEETNNSLQKEKELKCRLERAKGYLAFRNQLKGDDKLYRKYLMQALVQLGVTYQKSRDYDIAEYLCDVTLRLDDKNIDAKNNRNVCNRKKHRKLSEIRKASKELSEEGNRFAKIQYIKCLMMEENSEEKEDVLGLIEEILSKNQNDMEVLFLKGMYYKNCEQLDEAQQIFEDIYRRTPYIRKGTIGLKAYYNVAQCMLKREDIYSAKRILEQIIEECIDVSVPYEEKEFCISKDKADLEAQGDLLPGNLPQGDLLSEIDLGWCFMRAGRYGKAKELYENLLEKYKNMIHRMGHFNHMKVRNNLGECYLRMNNLESAQKQIDAVLKIEEDNAVALCLQAQCYMMNSTGDEVKNLETAMSLFEKAASNMPNDLCINSGWLLSAMMLYEKKKEDEKFIKTIEKWLKYSPSFYSMKACEKLTGFIRDRKEKLGDSNSEMQALYRAFARIQLGETEEGYGTFMNFLSNHRFRRLRAVTRGMILVHLFAIYEQVERIKDICRYTTGKEPDKEDFPVHYTRIETLKKLLPKDAKDQSRLRLMNTDYTNDFFEGNLFLELMNQANQAEDSQKRIMKYFPHWKNTSDTIIPQNGNVYFSSFSERKDDIHMWIPYADDAKGCSIMFAEDFLDIRRKPQNPLGISEFSDRDYPLYQVQYISKEDFAKIAARAKGENGEWKTEEEMIGEWKTEEEKKLAEILHCLRDIWKCLTQLRDCLADLEHQDDEKTGSTEASEGNIHWKHTKDTIYKFVADCLDEIRFLFKDPEYSHEQELRLIKHSYEPQVDEQSSDIPRLYVEVDRKIRIEEVCLGTKIDPLVANEIATWLYETDRVHKVSVSKRHYR